MQNIAQTRAIIQGITTINTEIKKRYVWLKHQNAIGFLLFSLSILAILAGWGLWANNSANNNGNNNVLTIGVIAWAAFFMSILHEIEHDLIHRLYFKNDTWAHKIVHNFMLLGVWLMRPLTANPWLRREVHIHHHQHSGTSTDIEERGVMNGESWDLRRLLATPDIILSYLLRQPRFSLEQRELIKSGAYSPTEAQMARRIKFWGMLPFPIPLHLIWYSFLAINLLQILGFNLPENLVFYTTIWAKPLIICLIAPNILRQFCLHFITSNIHYFGDVEDGNILQQTQVLTAWWALPFHVFCFNFGATHAIHHFVVMEPFYIRQLSAAQSYQIMRENGVRFNDFGTFFRANRYKMQ